jgi:hypothetical protein
MNRTEWILGGILTVLLIVVAVLAVLFWQPERSVEAPPTAGNRQSEEEGPDSARAAYARALVVAREWAEDAQLVDGSATWPPGTQFAPIGASWNFVFYSARSHQLALVTVVNGQAQLFRSRAAETAYQPLGVADWLLDSPEVIRALMANGGHDFLQQHGSATLTLKIEVDQTAIWQSGLTARESGNRLTLWFDAGTGQLLHQEGLP